MAQIWRKHRRGRHAAFGTADAAEDGRSADSRTRAKGEPMPYALRLIMLVILGMAVVTPAIAWEFQMSGLSEWRFRYLTRTGQKDVFGTMDANSVNLGINHLSTFPTSATRNKGSGSKGFGVLSGENNFGSDMSATEYKLGLFPSIIVNRAMKLNAGINLTSLGVWSDGMPLVAGRTNPPAGTPNSGYVNTLYAPLSTRPVSINVPNAYVTVQWIKASVKIPPLDISIGYRPSHEGMGLWKHGKNRASASFSIRAHYGPFSFGLAPYFSRRGDLWGTDISRNEGDSALTRKEHIRNYFRAAKGKLAYTGECMKWLLACDAYIREDAPVTTERAGALLNDGELKTPSNRDQIRYRFHLSGSYFSGSLFWNGEANWFNSWRSGIGSASEGLTREGNDIQGCWMYGTEVGSIIGPAKLTLNYVRSTGDNIATRTGESSYQGGAGLNDGYMGDWAYIMYHLYGTGVCWHADGSGQPFDVHHLGGRIDYAIASNLNAWALFSHAWRDSPTAWTLGGDGRIGVRSYGNDDLWDYQRGASTLMPVPDHAREIGWEIDLGLNWKLLEGLTWNTTFAYWKPGNWWGYAFPNTAAIY
ncbi:hypothetical protein ACFL2Q_15305, partial [Thermodesulfobacteriota bacterium]